MAVYTKINKSDLTSINRKFNFENFQSFKGIKQGIENTNYLLKSKNKKFILTIFEKRNTLFYEINGSIKQSKF